MSIYTEEEAKTKWCPESRPAEWFASTPHSDGKLVRGGNRDGNGKPDATAYCLGSGCMMWRWVFRFVRVETDEGEPEEWTDAWENSLEPPRGYCGKAGAQRIEP